MRVEVYSDIICPWCYIGKRRLERALTAFAAGDGVEVIYRPYQLDPEAPTTPVPLLQHLQRKFGQRAPSMVQQVTEAGRAEGIDMRLDRAIATNTLTAHRLLRLAEAEYGVAAQRELVEALFAGHFEHGCDLGDHSQLGELAVGAGLDRTRVAAYLASDEGLDEVRADFRAARELGIGAVPTFIFEKRYAIQGGQPAPVFLRALETVARETTGAETADPIAGSSMLRAAIDHASPAGPPPLTEAAR